MNKPMTVIKLPPKFILISRLSGGLTIGFSLIHILLSVAYYIFRYNCTAGSSTSTNGARYFWHTIYRVYILSKTCSERLTIGKLMDETTLLILVSVMLAVTVMFAIIAVVLLLITQDEGLTRHVYKVVYSYVACFGASLVVDITTASYFGVDYSYLSSLLKDLSAGSPANYKLEVIRQGVFWLMTIVLKGYVAYIINGIFVMLLIIYMTEIRNASNIDVHSIHKLGALSAYEQRRKPEENNWSPPEVYNNPLFMRGPQTNSGFVDDSTPPRSPWRPEPQRFDHISNRSFDRSDSWQRSQNSPSQNNGRPFSYLEDLKRPMQQKPLPSPMSHGIDSPWRREIWSQTAPPVPAPDYSPEQPRKLKSALKPAYM